MLKRFPRFVFGLVVCSGLLFANSADLLYQDNFSDGDYTTAQVPNGLSWTVVKGGAAVANTQLGIRQNRSLIVTNQNTSASEFTVVFDAWCVWSEAGRAVFLYKDSSNYYSVGLGGDPGIFRKSGNVETKLWTDPGYVIRLPHASSATATFKIYVKRASNSITIWIGKSGDGVDYAVQLFDTVAASISEFAGPVQFALETTDTTGASLTSFRVDNIAIYNTLILTPRTAMTYFVDAVNGDDSRSATQAQDISTPWKTIQKAADTAMSGDVVKVLPGIYHEQVTPMYSGGFLDSITYQANNPSDRPILDGTTIVSDTGWHATTITDFRGATHSVYKAPLSWSATMAYQDSVPMFIAQEPNQTNPNNQLDLSDFMPVPAAQNPGTSHTQLVDPSFLTQATDNYWVGATLLLYDGTTNAIQSATVTGYVAAQNMLVVTGMSAFIGSDQGRGDKYALRNHPGLLDQPGEFYIDTTAHQIYVWPYAGQNVSTVSASKYVDGFNLSSNAISWTAINGFKVRFYQNGVYFLNSCNNNTVENCEVCQNNGEGITGNGVSNITIDHCLIHDNFDDGASFGHGQNISITNSEITANNNNGIWFGSGGGSIFNVSNILVQGCYIHHQSANRMHPDNYQVQQCKNMTLTDNVFIQKGDQNLWTEFSDNYLIENNLFMGGPVGINSTIHSYLYNNVFDHSELRYDAHQHDAIAGAAPVSSNEYFKPVQAIIRNNEIIESAIAWPDTGLIKDKSSVYTVDHNYYNIVNSSAFSCWDFNGYYLGVNRSNSMIVTNQTFGTDYTFWCDASNSWSEPSRLVVFYKNAQNYYSIGLGSVKGIFRKLAGTETQIWSDPQSLVRLPHAGPATSRYQIHAAEAGGIVTLQVDRLSDGVGWDADIRDSLGVSAAAAFTATSVGLLDTVSTSGAPESFIDNVMVQSGATAYVDSFSDGDYTNAQGANGLTWQVVSGSVQVAIVNGFGIGVGAGSIVHRSSDSLATVIVRPPDSLYTVYDFHLKPTSPLIDAGTNVGLTKDKDGATRPQGSGVDIGPYEYPSGTAVHPHTASLRQPVLLMYKNPVRSMALIRVVNDDKSSGTLQLYTADGRLAQEIPVDHGVALLSAKQLRSGMYFISYKNVARGKIIVVK